MTPPLPMCLVFRLGGIGFAMPIEVIEEVHTAGADRQDHDTAELVYRGMRIPCLDLAARFGLPALPATAAAPVLIVKAQEMYWVVRVDHVEGVFPGDLFEIYPLPPLLSLQVELPYRHLLLWHGQPLVYCDQCCLATLEGGG